MRIMIILLVVIHITISVNTANNHPLCEYDSWSLKWYCASLPCVLLGHVISYQQPHETLPSRTAVQMSIISNSKTPTGAKGFCDIFFRVNRDGETLLGEKQLGMYAVSSFFMCNITIALCFLCCILPLELYMSVFQPKYIPDIQPHTSI